MHIVSLGLRDFRSYPQWEYQPDAPLTVLVGPNAVGKTNIVEAIQLVATGASFRRPAWPEVVRWGTPQAAVTMTAEGDGSFAEVELKVSMDGVREWRVGGVSKRRISDACRFVPVVTFTPDDLSIVKGPAEQRRTTLDALGEQLSVTYGALRRDYARVIRQRNTLLRTAAPDSLVDPWDEHLVRLGARLHFHRRGLALKVMNEAAAVHERMAESEPLGMQMCDRCGVGCEELSTPVTIGEIEEGLTNELSQRAHEERARGMSLVGPHRDDIRFTLGGRDARVFGSQGQQRTIALSWKWAEVGVIRDALQKTPVLLLDDVMSELDASRRAALTSLVQQDTQTFITTTTTDYFDAALLHRARVVSLGGGS